MPLSDPKPTLLPLTKVLDEILRGELRVPRLRRFAARESLPPEQAGDLLDSLYRGFSSGALLVWETDTPMSTLDIVGGLFVAPPQSGASSRLLLDGHQRLSTLMRTLGPALLPDLGSQGLLVAHAGPAEDDVVERAERWVFDVGPLVSTAGSRERFVLLKRDQEPTLKQLPLDIVLSPSMLSMWLLEREELSEAEVARAHEVRARFEAVVLPVLFLVGGSIEEATEHLKRIHASSVATYDFQMVAARAYEKTVDVQQSFAEARAEYLAPLGWDAVSDSLMLAVCAGLQKMSPVRYDIATLAAALRDDASLIERAFRSAVVATDVLAQCGVHGPMVLPYPWQLLILSVVLGRMQLSHPLSEETLAAAKKWFWITTYGEAFAGGNAAAFERCVAALEELIAGRSWAKMERDITRQVRPVEVFDFATPRSKASALSMARHQDEGRLNGAAHQALTRGAEALQLLLPTGRRAKWWHWVIVTPERGLQALRDALRRRVKELSEPGDAALLEGLGVSATGKGPAEALLEARRAGLLAEERAFVDSLGLVWAAG